MEDPSHAPPLQVPQPAIDSLHGCGLPAGRLHTTAPVRRIRPLGNRHRQQCSAWPAAWSTTRIAESSAWNSSSTDPSLTSLGEVRMMALST